MTEEDSSLKAEGIARPTSSPRRRALLYAGVAAVAALGGVGWAWRKFQPHSVADGALDSLWALSFERPEGGELAMSSLRGKPLVLNFWATWCPPCVEELPMLDAFFRQNSGNGWQVVGLAIDQPSSVRKWLQKTPLSFPVGLAGLGGTELGKSLGNAAGGLPFTVIVDGRGALLQRKMGKLETSDLSVLT